MPTIDEVANGYESLSEQFFDQMVPITGEPSVSAENAPASPRTDPRQTFAAEKPWMVLAGNHEVTWRARAK